MKVDMGAQRWMIVACLSFLGLVLLESVSAETVSCMSTEAECLATGLSSIAIINNNYRCCAPGFSMSAISTQCSCTRTSEVISCSQGPVACRNAFSISSDGQGNTQCCPLGFSMQAQMISVNRRSFRSCTCTKPAAGGSFQVIGGNGQLISFSGDGSNATALGRYFQNWQHRFQSGMSQAMGQLASSMGAMNRHLQGMGNYMTNIFNRVFRG